MSKRISSSREIVGRNLKAGQLPFRQVDTGNTYGFNNTLIQAAVQTTDRQTVTLVDYDIHRTVSVIGRRTLLSLARTMFWRIPALQAAILEQANLAANPFTPRYAGKNKAWGETAALWLNDWHKVFDLAGWPYDYESYVELLIVTSIVDGEIFTLLTEDASGNPRIQIIPSHRVGSRYQTGGSAKVSYTGNQLWINDILVDGNLPWTYSTPLQWEAPIIDGVIVDGQTRPIAYRVFDDPVVSSKYTDIGARSIFPTFIPMFPGQLRGISLLASSVFDWQDVKEFRDFEKLAQKTFSSRTIMESNEEGEIDPAKRLVTSATRNPDNSLLTPASMQVNGGQYTVFKANSGSKLEAFDWNRPAQNAQGFMDTIVRDAFRGTEWDTFFSLDPKHVGGAPMRVVVDKICRVLKKRRRMLAKTTLRVDTYGLAKGALRDGSLPMDNDWYRWTYQGPPDPTADRRYDAQTDQMEYELGWSTLADIEARRNGDWLLKREQRELEVDDLFTRAQKLADKFHISIQEAASQISLMGTATLSRREMETEPTQTQETGKVAPQGNQP
jgi:hypothetical protein